MKCPQVRQHATSNIRNDKINDSYNFGSWVVCDEFTKFLGIRILV